MPLPSELASAKITSCAVVGEILPWLTVKVLLESRAYLRAKAVTGVRTTPLPQYYYAPL